MYMLFMGDYEFPAGGAADFVGTYPTLFDAKEAALSIMGEEHFDWWHVAVLEDGRFNILAYS